MSKFVVKQKNGNNVVHWKNLSKAVTNAVRFLDNVIDATPYFFDKNKIHQKNERRIGLGTMGLAEMLMLMKIRCVVCYVCNVCNTYNLILN